MIIPHAGHAPDIDPTVFLAEGVHIIGRVKLGRESSIWFNSILRGDINGIVVGDRTNIQDLCVLHVTHDHQVHIGSGVTVGHRAIVHGASVGENCLIGMGAILLDGVRVEKECLVAAGSVVKEGSHIPEGSLVAGIPAAVKRKLTEKEKDSIRQSAERYIEYSKSYRK